MLNKVLSIAFLLFSFLGFSQTPKVVLSINPTDVEVGESFTITVTSNVPGDIEIDNLPGSYFAGMMSSYQKHEMDIATGNLQTITYHTQSGAIGKAGKYKIGPVWVKNGRKTYSSNTVIINVGKKVPMTFSGVTAQQLNDPAFGIIQMNKMTIYEGEPIVVSAKIYSKFEPTHVGNYVSYSNNGTMETHDLSRYNSNIKVATERFKGNSYYTFEHDRKLVFPSGTGQFKIDPYHMNLRQGYKVFPLTSSGGLVTILPLPANPPNDFIGAVGDFTVSRSLDTSKIKQGDVFKMFLTIEGTGNIQNSLKPILNLPKGFVVYGDPLITENISFNSRGATGSILYEYNIQVSQHGNITLPGTSISFFDPESKKYVQVTSEDHPLKVERDNTYITASDANVEDTPEEEVLSTATPRMSQSIRSKTSIYGTPIFWSGVGLPVLSALLFMFILKRREDSADKIEAKQVIRKKDKELNDYLAISKSLIHSEDGDTFFSSIESALRKTFEVQMKVQQDRILSKQEIYDFIDTKGNEQLKHRVQQLFRTCEESRFGFAPSEDSRQAAYNELSEILKQVTA